jgi:hypothetical protein
VQNLQITIIEDSDRYNPKKKERPDKIGTLKFTGAYALEEAALEEVCNALLALFPHDPIALLIRYEIENH